MGEDGKKLTNTWQDGYYLDEEGKITRNAWVGDTYLGEDGLPATPPDSDVSNEVKRIFVGDSRTVGLYQIMTEDTLVKADSDTVSVESAGQGPYGHLYRKGWNGIRLAGRFRCGRAEDRTDALSEIKSGSPYGNQRSGKHQRLHCSL